MIIFVFGLQQGTGSSTDANYGYYSAQNYGDQSSQSSHTTGTGNSGTNAGSFDQYFTGIQNSQKVRFLLLRTELIVPLFFFFDV